MLLEKNRQGQYSEKCDYCGWSHKWGKRNSPAFGKLVTNVVRRTTSKWYASPQRNHCIEIQDVIQERGQIGPVKENVCTSVMCMKLKDVVKIILLRT